MENDKKTAIIVDHSFIDNATDEQIEAFALDFSKGDEKAIAFLDLYGEAAAEGDKSAFSFIERFFKILDDKKAKFMELIGDGDRKAIENARRIVERYKQGALTLAEKEFLLEYTQPAERDIDQFIASVLSDPAAVNDFLEGLTPAKVKKALPAHELTPQEEKDLTYTAEESAAIRSRDKEEKAAAKAAKRERARHFLSGLYLGDFIGIVKIATPKPKKKLPADIPQGRAHSVSTYITTKDILSKAIFNEPGIDGKLLNMVREDPGSLTLWTTGKGKNAKNVTVYTRLEPDREALKAAGITIGKNVSRCAREVYGALLSSYLAGNRLLSLNMVGKIIFNTKDENALTEAQRQYIVDGATEIFSTSLYIDTTRTRTDKSGKKRAGYISLLEATSVNITRTEQLFPGRITSAIINGNLVKTAIELFELPTLYELQDSLEKGQFLRVPVELLQIPGRTDEDMILIRAYLLRRIDIMKHSKAQSRFILYEKILEELEIDPTDRAQRNRKSSALKRVERVLDYWKGEGYINGYRKLTANEKPVKNNAPLYKLEILL